MLGEGQKLQSTLPLQITHLPERLLIGHIVCDSALLRCL